MPPQSGWEWTVAACHVCGRGRARLFSKTRNVRAGVCFCHVSSWSPKAPPSSRAPFSGGMPPEFTPTAGPLGVFKVSPPLPHAPPAATQAWAEAAHPLSEQSHRGLLLACPPGILPWGAGSLTQFPPRGEAPCCLGCLPGHIELLATTGQPSPPRPGTGCSLGLLLGPWDSGLVRLGVSWLYWRPVESSWAGSAWVALRVPALDTSSWGLGPRYRARAWTPSSRAI